jgi:hypothetical protein
MKNILTVLGVAATFASMLAGAAYGGENKGAPDKSQSDRNEKPRCVYRCETGSRCVEPGGPLEPCKRYETYQYNCREECS